MEISHLYVVPWDTPIQYILCMSFVCGIGQALTVAVLGLDRCPGCDPGVEGVYGVY